MKGHVARDIFSTAAGSKHSSLLVRSRGDQTGLATSGWGNGHTSEWRRITAISPARTVRVVLNLSNHALNSLSGRERCGEGGLHNPAPLCLLQQPRDDKARRQKKEAKRENNATLSAVDGLWHFVACPRP